MLKTNYYDQRILKPEHSSGHNTPTHPNPNVVRILKSVEKKWMIPKARMYSFEEICMEVSLQNNWVHCRTKDQVQHISDSILNCNSLDYLKKIHECCTGPFTDHRLEGFMLLEFRRKRLWYSVLFNLVVTIWCILIHYLYKILLYCIILH